MEYYGFIQVQQKILLINNLDLKLLVESKVHKDNKVFKVQKVILVKED